MDIALTLVALIAIAIAASAFSSKIGIAAPLVLILVGIGGSFLPFVPHVELTPELVLVGLLPPLLYSAALGTSLIDFKANLRPIALLSVGLVIFTTVGIGVLVHSLLPVSWPAALALGAVVAPPDAVAATTIARRVGLPRRIITILEGESLVNDATAIVVLRTSIAAIAGSVSVIEMGLGFLLSAVGGIAVGLVVAVVVGRIRRRIEDDITDVAVSLLTPWVAYLPAEEIHVPGLSDHPSGVLAVVTAGLILGHRSSALQSATSRMFERTNWSTISFVLENLIFLLIGLQMRSIIDDLSQDALALGVIIGTSFAVLAGVIILRAIWVFPALYVPRAIRSGGTAEDHVSWREPLIISWAGMRGVVTLAAVFLLPVSTEHRPALVMIAFVVTVGTLLLHGLTLPALIRILGVEGPDRHEDYLQMANVYQSAANAGLRYLDEEVAGTLPEGVEQRLRQRTLDRANSMWERLGGVETPSAQYARARAAMLQRERAEVLRIRATGHVDQSILRRVLDALDVEESILDRVSDDESTADRETQLKSPTVLGACSHLQAFGATPEPRTPDGCEECLRDGSTWVHLRLCMTCGHVGCCDSSDYRHATKHFHAEGHPVMRSFEAGEAWRWCFVDQVTG